MTRPSTSPDHSRSHSSSRARRSSPPCPSRPRTAPRSTHRGTRPPVACAGRTHWWRQHRQGSTPRRAPKDRPYAAARTATSALHRPATPRSRPMACPRARPVSKRPVRTIPPPTSPPATRPHRVQARQSRASRRPQSAAGPWHPPPSWPTRPHSRGSTSRPSLFVPKICGRCARGKHPLASGAELRRRPRCVGARATHPTETPWPGSKAMRDQRHPSPASAPPCPHR